MIRSLAAAVLTTAGLVALAAAVVAMRVAGRLDR